MQRFFAIGNVTKEPEYGNTQSGLTFCKYGLAVSRRYGQDEVDFFNIITWRKLADNCHNYVHKGDKVAISGSVQIRTYEANDGSKRTAVDIVADEVEFLTPKAETTTNAKTTEQLMMRQLKQQDMFTPVDDEQLPF